MCCAMPIVDRLAEDGEQSEFLASLDIGRRMRMIDPTVPLGSIGAVRAAHAVSLVDGDRAWRS